jgi:hypothetical protein
MENYVTAGQATDGSIIWRMLFASWMNKATDRHSESVRNTCFSYGNTPQCYLIRTLPVFLGSSIQKHFSLVIREGILNIALDLCRLVCSLINTTIEFVNLGCLLSLSPPNVVTQ